MATQLITKNVWYSITHAAKNTNYKSFVAVAYFGQGGARMLPLTKGSLLVVDASEKAVKTGQTCPDELLKLYYKGVKIYSLPNLHAKLFVIGKALFIGSTNVSSNSAETLTEVLFRTSEVKSVENAKEFIKSFCKVEMGPDLLARLQKMYRPPRFIGKRKPGAKRKITKVNASGFFTYQLESAKFTKEEKKQSEMGYSEAEKKRIIKSRHIVDEFQWENGMMAKKNDIILQVVEEDGATYVCPPGILIHTRKWRNGKKVKTLYYVEIPDVKRKNLKWVNKQLNPTQRKLLKRDGRRTKEFAEKIHSLWHL